MTFPRYPAYKDSGVTWLGEVPEHWEVLPLKAGFNIVGGSTPKSENESYWEGDIVWVTPSDLSKLTGLEISASIRQITEAGLASCGTSLVPANSIVLSTRAPIGSLAIAETELCTNQGCKSLVPSERVVTRFYAHLLSISTAELNIRGRGTTFLELSSDELGAFKVGMPPKTEQTAIAIFLDRETAKIDDLIAEQRSLTALLKEKRQAVISHAVTKGLNPKAAMKDSGVAWLGEVPGHWEVKPLKHVIQSITSGVSVNSTDLPASSDEIGVLKTSCVYTGDFAPLENKTVVPEEYERVACPVLADTLIVSRMNTPELVGAAGVVYENHPNLFLPDRLWQVAFENTNPSFVHYWTRTRAYRAQVEMACEGTSSSMQNLAQSDFRNFCFPHPEINEQTAIVAYLNHQTTQIDTLITETEKTITLLQERRSALISAAVTGKMDVRVGN